MSTKTVQFLTKILQWGKDNPRKMPWYKESDPYRIWISEIILQQTRVEQGWNYYINFIDKFPDVKTLAQTSEDYLLKQWEGLGYYSRARNLHKAAKLIVKEMNGIFPSEYDSVISLPGVGPYTAAAIMSFAYQKRYPVVDGNVLRVISRVFGIQELVDKKEGSSQVQQISKTIIDKANPAEYNQVIMNFGALQCNRNPNCTNCVLNNICFAHNNDQVQVLPRKTAKQKKQIKYFHFIDFIDTKSQNRFIRKRVEKGIWQGLYAFPLIQKEDNKAMTISELTNYVESEFGSKNELELVATMKKIHLLTHIRIEAIFYKIVGKHGTKRSGTDYISTNTLSEFAFPKLLDIYLQKYL